MGDYTVDYSQSGQAVIVSELVTPDTPRVVVDIGAHDGVDGSNSRALLEQGWRGVLVEPMPSIFRRLRDNSARFSEVSVVMAACAEQSGRATMRVGTDGDEGQMSSLSKHALLRGSLSERSIEVETISVRDLFARENIPDDFGVLLIDTEGYDYAVLCGLKETQARPRILVTEEFAGTDRDKYRLLGEMDYLFAGAWGSDSLWVARWHTADTNGLQFPLRRISSAWKPVGKRTKGGQGLVRSCGKERGDRVGVVRSSKRCRFGGHPGFAARGFRAALLVCRLAFRSSGCGRTLQNGSFAAGWIQGSGRRSGGRIPFAGD